MTFLRVALLVVLFATPLSAQTEMRFDPATPAAGEPFTFTLSGFWRDSNVPRLHDVFVAGPNRVVITYEIVPQAGLPVVVPFSVTANIPGLAAGKYTVTLRILEGDVNPLGEATVNVTGVAPEFSHAFPPAGGLAGSALVRFDAPCPPKDCSNAEVFFDGVAARQVRVSGSSIYAVTPAFNRARPVDVRIRTASYDSTRHAGFTYVSAGDYETILLPSLTDQELPGAFGSRWRVDHHVFNGNGVALEPYVDFMHVEWDCPTLCPTSPVIPARQVSPIPTMWNFTREPNWLIHVRKPLDAALRWSLRVRDVSRQEQTWGTELPVVRERDYTSGVVQLFDVPLHRRFRPALRIYAQPIGLTCCTDARVRVYSIAGGKLLHETTVPLRHAPYGVGNVFSPGAGSPEFPIQPETGTLDLGTLPGLADHDRVRIEVDGHFVRSLWAYVSITNNETQHVTVVSPQ